MSETSKVLTTKLASEVGEKFRLAINPMPLHKPKINPNFVGLPVVERVVEALRFNLFEFEYMLSPSGWLRAYLKMNLIACFVLGIPALFVVPIITYLLGSFVTWTEYIFEASLNLLYTVLTFVAMIGIVFILIKFVFSRR